MPLKMGYVCSCGSSWDTDDWTLVESHLESNTTHVVTEGYYHTSGTGIPDQIPVSASDGSIYRMQVDTAGGVSSESDSGQATKLPKSNLSASTDPTVDEDNSEGYEVGSRWLNLDSGKEFVCLDSTTGSAVWNSTTESDSGVWGELATMSDSMGVTTHTSSTTWKTKISLSVVVAETGVYRLGWAYGWSADTTSTDFQAYISENDSSIVLHNQEPKDSGGTYENTGTDQKYLTSGFIYRSLSPDTYTYEIHWKTQKAGVEASIWDATLEFWRHS